MKNVHEASAVASALRMYARNNIQASRDLTPAAMLKAASRITGKRYKRGQYEQAADDLRIWIDGTFRENKT